jgi:hypothetical protein
MSDIERQRALTLARQRNSIKAIAARMGYSYSRIRHLVERAEQRGELPGGTLAACCCRPAKPAPEPSDEPPPSLQVYAPHRSQARRLGHCSACEEPTEIVVMIRDFQVRLCRSHAARVMNDTARSLASARRQRIHV